MIVEKHSTSKTFIRHGYIMTIMRVSQNFHATSCVVNDIKRIVRLFPLSFFCFSSPPLLLFTQPRPFLLVTGGGIRICKFSRMQIYPLYTPVSAHTDHPLPPRQRYQVPDGTKPTTGYVIIVMLQNRFVSGKSTPPPRYYTIFYSFAVYENVSSLQ